MNVIKILQNTRCSSCKLNAIRRNYYLNSILFSAASKDEIVIPKRIPRGPTDILKALASVTKRDPTAAHYKFHDDPYLIPASNHQKRIYALAQESGRKAAKWIRDENPALFQHVESEPPIEAYFPRARYNENDELDNEILFKIIHSGLLNDAVTVYKIMKKRGDEISEENKQALLELVSFFNETEEIDEEFIEEKWYAQTAKENTFIKKTWKDVGLAQELFDELPESAKSYSALIKGMTKYHQVDKAFQYFTLAEEKGIVLSRDAYNSLIRVAFYMADGEDQRWEIIENLLKTMNDHGLPPNLLTLNSVLFSLSRVKVNRHSRKYALKMLAEVKQFGVQPSLATYYYMLNIFYNDGSSSVSIMQEILDDLENREITIQDPMDVNFFHLAMEKCRFHIRDKDIAHRLNQLLWHKNNYNFIGNSYKEASFYRNYFYLIVQTELMENVMQIYDFLVPHIYTPEISVMEELIKCATMNGAVDLYARFWADTVAFEMQEKIQILSALLEGMTLNQPPPTTPPNKTAIDFAEIAWSVLEKTESKTQQKSIIIEWTGKMLGELIALLLHGDQYRRAIQVFKKLIKDQNYIVGVPEPGVFTLFVDACIKHEDLKQAMELVVYCSENGYGEAKPIAKKILQSFSLSPAYQTQLTVLVGPDIFNDEEKVEKSTA